MSAGSSETGGGQRSPNSPKEKRVLRKSQGAKSKKDKPADDSVAVSNTSNPTSNPTPTDNTALNGLLEHKRQEKKKSNLKKLGTVGAGFYGAPIALGAKLLGKKKDEGPNPYLGKGYLGGDVHKLIESGTKLASDNNIKTPGLIQGTIGSRAFSNMSNAQVNQLVEIFKKRSDEITQRRIAPGVNQTRLIGRG